MPSPEPAPGHRTGVTLVDMADYVRGKFMTTLDAYMRRQDRPVSTLFRGKFPNADIMVTITIETYEGQDAPRLISGPLEGS